MKLGVSELEIIVEKLSDVVTFFSLLMVDLLDRLHTLVQI